MMLYIIFNRPDLHSELSTFHKLSGLTVHLYMAFQSFRDLGIYITASHNLLYKTNYPPPFHSQVHYLKRGSPTTFPF